MSSITSVRKLSDDQRKLIHIIGRYTAVERHGSPVPGRTPSRWIRELQLNIIIFELIGHHLFESYDCAPVPVLCESVKKFGRISQEAFYDLRYLRKLKLIDRLRFTTRWHETVGAYRLSDAGRLLQGTFGPSIAKDIDARLGCPRCGALREVVAYRSAVPEDGRAASEAGSSSIARSEGRVPTHAPSQAEQAASSPSPEQAHGAPPAAPAHGAAEPPGEPQRAAAPEGRALPKRVHEHADRRGIALWVCPACCAGCMGGESLGSRFGRGLGAGRRRDPRACGVCPVRHEIPFFDLQPISYRTKAYFPRRFPIAKTGEQAVPAVTPPGAPSGAAPAAPPPASPPPASEKSP